ncbi:MAG: hypothetical protein AB4057_11550 [Crocosphaera sp.]
MNYKSLFGLSVVILVNFLPLNKANALTVHFSRQYLEDVLVGEFTATDKNNDTMISPNEVKSFYASFTSDYNSLDNITVEEAKSIEEFHYKIGQDNELSFRVKTTGRELPYPNPYGDINLTLDVDFQRTPNHNCYDASNLDLFHQANAIEEFCDPHKTGITQVMEDISSNNNSSTQVPEPTSIIALLSLVSCGAISKLK